MNNISSNLNYKFHIKIFYRLIVVLTLLLVQQNIQAQNWNQIIKAAAGDRLTKSGAARSGNDFYGYSVAIDGNYAVAGAYQESEDTTEQNTLSSSGSAFVLYYSAGTWSQIKKLTASVRLANDNFGYTVAISGDYIIVGAPQEDEDASEANTLSSAGSAYIFKRNQGGTNNWGQIKKICPANRLASDQFGISVAISGSYAIVGAYLEDEDASEANTLSAAGSAYIFKADQGGTDNWGQIKKLCAASRLASDNFGMSVAISGSYAIVGALYEDEDASESNTLSGSGSAYIFKADQGGTDNWGQVKKICASTRAVTDQFGYSVAISGNYAIVGANFEDDDASEATPLTSSGSAYIFKADQGGTDNWGQIKKLCAANRLANDLFGTSVSISGSYAIVGAYFEDEDASEANNLSASGSAYIFKIDQGGTDNWGQIKKISATTRAANDHFGWAVSISGSNVISGAYDEDEDASELNNIASAGSAYFFTANQGGTDNWGQVQKTVMTGYVANDNFGNTIAIDGNYAIVGAYQEDEDATGINSLTDAGAAYILKYSNGSWTQIKKITASTRGGLDNFGISVAISGSYAIVGAYLEDEDASEANTLSASGSAYIFKADQGGTDNWGQIKKICAANRLANDRFGISVSINGSYAIVGAYMEDEDASEANNLSASGSAYIFKADQGGTDNWGQIKKICAASRLASDQFGYSVAINGSYAIVGANLEDEDASEANNLSASGSAYIFKADQGGTDNWGQIKKICAANRLANDQFGFSVAISGSYAIVGAYLEDEDASEATNLSSSGSAYIFKTNQGGADNWGQIKKICAANRLASDQFGYSVAISGNYAIVGANLEDQDASEANNLSSSGSAYIFEADQGGTDNWGQIKKICASSRAASDNFGYSVGISGSYAIIGAYLEDEDASEANTLNGAGSAYFFYNGCHSSLALPATTNTTYTGSYSSTDENGWTHYCSSGDKLLLSLKIGASGAVVNASEIQLKTGATTTYSSSGSGGMITNSGGYAIIDRRWSIAPTSQPSSGNVGIKYYFTATEYADLVTASAALSSPSTITAVTQLNMYKATSGAAFADPHTVNGIILSNGSTPSTSVWKYAIQGTSDHSAEYEVSSFSGGGGGFGGGGGPLPVTLISFTGKIINNNAVLLWTTATEINNDRYEIERSLNGKDFLKVGEVKGKGNSNQFSQYFFKDAEISNIPEKNIYYRLKQIDYSGDFEYSKIIVVSPVHEKASRALVSPNPFTNELQLVLPKTEYGETTIQIINLFGVLVMNITQSLENDEPINLDTQHLPSGMYIMTINQNGAVTNYKIIKN